MSLYRLSPDAARDIRGIRDNVERHRPRRAASYIAGLKHTLTLLGRIPHIGRERPDIRAGLRSFRYGSYLVIYRPTRRGVDIVRVVHGRRDLNRIFGP